MMLFAMMIYNAFNVWNNREIKEIALLKSAGMTEKQVKKMIKKKNHESICTANIDGSRYILWSC